MNDLFCMKTSILEASCRVVSWLLDDVWFLMYFGVNSGQVFVSIVIEMRVCCGLMILGLDQWFFLDFAACIGQSG